VLGNDEKEENDSATLYPLLDVIQFGLCPCDTRNSILGNNNN
jgi:hypothetical protein